MKRLTLIVAVLILLAGFLVWWFSPTQVVARRTRELCQVLTLEADSRAAGRSLGSFKLDGLLQPNVELDIPSIADANGTLARSEIGSTFTWLCNNAKETRFKIERIDAIFVDRDLANVRARIEARVLLSGTQVIDSPGDASFTWRKAEDGWRLEKVSWRE
jgi:hypothetical protein